VELAAAGELMMASVVQATCPGCRKQLRIPSGWMHQAVRCKHCGMISGVRPAAISAQPNPPMAVSVAPPLAAPVHPHLTAAPAVAAPQAARIASPSVNAFAGLDGDANGPAPARHRYRRGRWKLFTAWGLFLVAAAVLAVVFWPLIKDAVNQAQSQIADAAKTDKEPPPGEQEILTLPIPGPKEEPKETPKKDVPKKETPKKENPKGSGPPKDKPRTDPPKKDSPKRETPANPPAISASLFPRRALAIGVNNYLFLNPINYSSMDRKSNNVRTLLDRFTTGLKVPAEQVFELSDAAQRERARPPVKPAIEKIITNFVGTSRPQDRIIVLMVAHSVEIDGEPYLIPLEGDQESKDLLIPLSWLYEKIGAAPARQKILILDTCRFNPTRGQERPGGEPMGEKLDAKLKDPPAGVQVWTACIAGQRSYEFDSSADGKVNNGLFLDCLQRALLHGIEGKIQRPDEPIQLELLVEKVNALMKSELDTLKLVQTSRLSGSAPATGAAYDPSQPPAAKFAIEVPRPAGDDLASLGDVGSILEQIDVPPLKLTRDYMPIRPESMPPFSAKLLAEYKDDGEKTPFRLAVEKARRTLHKQLRDTPLQEEWEIFGTDENKYKAGVKDYQEKEVARTMRELEEALDDLRAAGKQGRKEEKSKRWQANYDYVFARLEAQLAYLYEYDSALGEMRKELPERGPRWRLASQKKLSGDSQGRKYMSESGKILDKLVKENAGTPWEVLAKRDKLSNLGLKWQPNK
jgi:hypothetical protein